jgi:BTB/POZ domain
LHWIQVSITRKSTEIVLVTWQELRPSFFKETQVGDPDLLLSDLKEKIDQNSPIADVVEGELQLGPSHNLIASIDKLRVDHTLTDVTLQVKGKFLKTHKQILAAISPVFKVIVENNFWKLAFDIFIGQWQAKSRVTQVYEKLVISRNADSNFLKYQGVECINLRQKSQRWQVLVTWYLHCNKSNVDFGR